MEKAAPNIIAIDGTAASGKGTLARRLADTLGFSYLDTGKLYRYVGYSLLKGGDNPSDEDKAVPLARTLNKKLRPEDLQDPALKSDEAGKAASQVAAIPGVRAALLDYQRGFAANPPTGNADNKGAILDGRDIGTVICPEAPLKLFITAKTTERAQRRYKELQSAGVSCTYEAVLADMQERDARDAGRKTAPMKPADDAIVIDTSNMDIDAVFEKAMSYVQEKLGSV